MQKIEKLFGDRVALQLVEEEYEGMLVPAPTEQKMHMLSKVLAVGDKCKGVKVGDIVFWQWNALIERNCKYMLNGQPMFVMLRGNLVARLGSRLVKLKDFEVLGEYCLARRVVEQPSKLIVLPDAAEQTNPEMVLRFYLEQKGSEVTLEMNVGDELVVDRNAANPVSIEGTNYSYVHKNYVLGVLGAR